MSTENTPRDPECLFCRIVSGEIPADVVAQDELAVAFRDLEPQAPLHVLVVPRAHHRDVGALAQADPDSLVAVARLAAQVAGDENGGQFRFVFNSGAQAHQSVFHVHGHVLGGRDMTWPPG
ncbi:histidine triad nucleotide-binding protein [Angustibacter peucedani]